MATMTQRQLLRAVVLLNFAYGLVLGVDMQGVSLVGGTGEYLEVSLDAPYQLQCLYRAGYDDVVDKVEWRIYDNPVYTWNKNRVTPSVRDPLLGSVDLTPASDPHFIHFTKVTHDLVGNYTCVVTSTKGIKTSTPFSLRVVDIAPVEFETHVNLVTDENDELSDSDVDTDQACTLLWDFKSPAIYPRPNITCGYYSYDYDDVTTYLPAGLSLQQFLNGSWQAVFDHTKVEVKDIPVHGRLGCSVRIPKTTYKKLIKFDNDLVIDNKIDATGCPAPSFSHNQQLLYQIKGATVSCRGDLVPTRNSPVKIMLKCPSYSTAVFKNGSSIWNWQLVAGCSEQELVWKRASSFYDDYEELLGDAVNFHDLPYCMGSYSAAGMPWNNVYRINISLAIISLLLIWNL